MKFGEQNFIRISGYHIRVLECICNNSTHTVSLFNDDFIR